MSCGIDASETCKTRARVKRTRRVLAGRTSFDASVSMYINLV
jgi:hypothetical protein